jgi:hypothetical protein
VPVDGDPHQIPRDWLGSDVQQLSSLSGVVSTFGIPELGVIVLNHDAGRRMWNRVDGYVLLGLVPRLRRGPSREIELLPPAPERAAGVECLISAPGEVGTGAGASALHLAHVRGVVAHPFGQGLPRESGHVAPVL